MKNNEDLNNIDVVISDLLTQVDYENSLKKCFENAFLVDEQKTSKVIDEINSTSHCYFLKPNTNNDDYCYKELALLMLDELIKYVIPRSEIDRAERLGDTEERLQRLYKKAKRKMVDFYATKKELEEKGEIEEYKSKSGEGGEELLFLFAEQVLQLPQALSKMNVKTSGKMHFHGADGIHIELSEDKTKLALYYGEVKVYEDFNTAVNNCLSGIAPLLKREEKEDGELDLLNSYCDLGELNAELVDKLKDYFDPDIPKCKELTEVRGLCLIGFNESDFVKFDKEETAKKIVEKSTKWISHFKKKTIENNIETVYMHVVFIPMTCVQTFRDTFKNELRNDD